MLAASEDWADDLRRALDAMATSCVILADDGRVLYANAGAERLLGRNDGLRVKNGRLTAERASDAAAIRAALAGTVRLAEPPRASSRTAAAVHDVPVVNVFRREARPVSLLFLPLRREYDPRRRGDGRARALVVLHDPDAVLSVDPTLLARIHDLTPTEAQLAAALASGKTVAEFAATRGSSEATARVHLKRVLEKTGTRRQADLVRAVLGIGVRSVIG